MTILYSTLSTTLNSMRNAVSQQATHHLHLAAFAPVLAIAALLRLYDLGHGHPGLAIYTSIFSHTYKSFHNWLYPNMFADGSILADKPPLFFGGRDCFPLRRSP